MKGQAKRKQRAHVASVQRKRAKQRDAQKRRQRGRREAPRGKRERRQHLRPVVQARPDRFDVMGWLTQRRQERQRQKVA